MTTLNNTFERELTLEDEGYESGSKIFSIPTPLRQNCRVHHISSNDNISFDPSTPCTTATHHLSCKSICHHLLFSSTNKKSTPAFNSTAPSLLHQHPIVCVQPSSVKTSYTIPDAITDNKDDFQTITLDDHWTTDPIPDRCLCIHEHSQPILCVLSHAHTAWIQYLIIWIMLHIVP